MTCTRRLVSWLAYPTAIMGAVVVHIICVNNGVSLQIATFGPILCGCFLITLLELTFPHRDSWLADREDVINDSTYMLLVQILLPQFFGFLVVIALLGNLQMNGMTLDAFWPHTWPVYFQALLMMVTADFMRYWVHRLAHEWPPLWRLHAVHHSPHKLYWTNVGRFHPFEKLIQYLFDALPFIVFGVSGEVLSLYFVFYALNGFFQHCNIELKMGFLNYIISGPELHRWHHSMLTEESNHNYGNNLIIWDLLFGTWYLPRERLVGALGLVNRNYPMDFFRQLASPFSRGLDKAK